jgi:hypothetical protein
MTALRPVATVLRTVLVSPNSVQMLSDKAIEMWIRNVVGGQIIHTTGNRSCFIFMAAYDKGK